MTLFALCIAVWFALSLLGALLWIWAASTAPRARETPERGFEYLDDRPGDPEPQPRLG